MCISCKDKKFSQLTAKRTNCVERISFLRECPKIGIVFVTA